jgi:hypothetical protein
VDTPRPSRRTNRTRRVPHPVLIEQVAPLARAAPLRAISARAAAAATERAAADAAGRAVVWDWLHDPQPSGLAPPPAGSFVAPEVYFGEAQPARRGEQGGVCGRASGSEVLVQVSIP